MVLIPLAIIALVVVFLIVQYNGLIKRRNSIENAWSQIGVQLKRRHDLIPNLLETVKGYAAHEQSTLDAVIRARNAAMQVPAANVAGQAVAENGLSGTLKSLFALSESYPDLKANQNFLSLQEELTSTEDKIAYARQRYNDEVGGYNTKTQTFPTALIAKQFKFGTREYFQVDDAATADVTVKF